jgi:class 3 adenylate cyclase
MICLQCGSNVDDGKFCGDCGSPLPWECGSCGSENPPGKKFCRDCGAAGAVTPTTSQRRETNATRAEHRQLTIMFADMVGSAALGARFDREDVREIEAKFRGCIKVVVDRFGGFVARYMGDGALVYFGYPSAHEADAERAIRAGLAIAEAVGQLDTIAGPPGTLSARIGIATGLALVGDLIGSGASLEWTVVGEAANLASRLQQHVAKSGMVVVDDVTRRLVGGLFEYRDLGPHVLRGFSAPVRAWAVLAEGIVDSRYEALRAGEIPLVGRTEELELLLRRWEQVRAGEGRAVLLLGEAGVGKSRLIAALEQKVREVPHAVIHWLCSPLFQDTPLYPVVRQIERSAKVLRDDSPEVKLDKLRTWLATGDRSETDIEADVDIIAYLLSIPRTAEEAFGALGLQRRKETIFTAEDVFGTLTPQRKKEVIFAAILRRLEWEARKTPLLLKLEDIHWADPTTTELLSSLIESVERLPIMLVVTRRPNVQPSWTGRPQVTVQFLPAFNQRDGASLIKEVIGDRILPKSVIDRILVHADGVPLFIEELTKAVLEKGLLQEGDADFSPFEPLSPDAVPTSLQASLMARLDAVPAAKEVAQIGSVIGREFSFELIQTLSGVAAKRLEQTLGELVQSGLLLERGAPPKATYTFKHALVQDAAYASLLRDERRKFHLAVAETLEKDTTGATTTEPELLARHFAEAGAPDKAIDYYLKAAGRTTGRFAFAEMVSQLHKGLRQLEHFSKSVDAQRRELALQVALGRALIDHQGSGSEAVREAFERAHDLCLALGDMRQLLSVFDGLVLNYHFGHSEPMKMLGYAAEIFGLGQKIGDAQLLLWARRSRSSANLLLGRFAEARDEMRLVIDTYGEMQLTPEAQQLARDPRVSTCTLLGICLTALGYPDSGTATSLEGVRHAETVNHVVSLIVGLRRACVQRVMQRNVPGVLDLSRRLLAVNAKYETFLGAREGTIFYGWAELKTHYNATLSRNVESCLDQLEAAKHWVLLPFLMASMAEIKGDNGDTEGAVALLDRAAKLVEFTGEQWCEAEIIRLQARFGAKDPNDATKLLQASLAKAREQGAKFWELRTATSLAELWRNQDRHGAAREVLAPIYTWFTEGFDTPDLVAARTLLGEIDLHLG